LQKRKRGGTERGGRFSTGGSKKRVVGSKKETVGWRKVIRKKNTLRKGGNERVPKEEEGFDGRVRKYWLTPLDGGGGGKGAAGIEKGVQHFRNGSRRHK